MKMKDAYALRFDVPSGEMPTVAYGSHFSVVGKICHQSALPEDAILTVKLIDGEGRMLRFARQDRKNNPNIYACHPDLTCYEESLDPGREKMKRFGFPELMVRDLNAPEASMRDATIKCWYSDDTFKALIVSATDQAHGLICDDGVCFADENGNPYTVLPRGRYTLVAELADDGGTLLARATKELMIGDREDQLICRFNPIAHRKNMTAWSEQTGFFIMNDPLPGYLDPYLGHWDYHMGLLPLYRACDLAMFEEPKIRMFVYLIDPTSTSYETELAFLQSKGYVASPERFEAYHYDIGEAELGERKGEIRPFEEDSFLHVYRVDTVNEKAQENIFVLNGEGVITSVFDTDVVKVCSGEKIAITGVVRPWQLDPEAFVLRADNTYEIRDTVEKMIYVFDDGERRQRVVRNLLMERINDGKSIGQSVYEFYNLFRIDPVWKGKRVTVEITAADHRGENLQAKQTIVLEVI